MADAFGSIDTSIKAAGVAEALGGVGSIAVSYSASFTPSADNARFRSELEAGTLSNWKSGGVGTHTDQTA